MKSKRSKTYNHDKIAGQTITEVYVDDEEQPAPEPKNKMSDAEAAAIRTTIEAVNRLAKKYGKLMQGETLPYPEVLRIIEYYEQDGEKSAMIALEKQIATLQAQLSKAQGAAGGLTRRINKLEDEVKQMNAVKKNNAKLSRVTSHASELVDHLEKDHNKHVDMHDDSLNTLPLYVKLRTELNDI